MSDSDEGTVVKRRRRGTAESVHVSSNTRSSASRDGKPPFDLIAAFGEEEEHVTVRDRGERAVEFMRRCGGAEALWRATITARKEGRGVINDDHLRGNQAWRQGLQGPDFRFGSKLEDDLEGLDPESFIGKRGASLKPETEVRRGRGYGRGAGRGGRRFGSYGAKRGRR